MSKELDWVFIFLPFLPRGTGADSPEGAGGRFLGSVKKKKAKVFLNHTSFDLSKVCYLLLLSLFKQRLQAVRPTQVILKLLGASVLSRSNQVPHEAFDFVVSTVMDQAVRQQGPADGFYIPLCQLLLKTAVFENVFPTAPPGR